MTKMNSPRPWLWSIRDNLHASCIVWILEHRELEHISGYSSEHPGHITYIMMILDIFVLNNKKFHRKAIHK